jgi:hypothetical protein
MIYKFSPRFFAEDKSFSVMTKSVCLPMVDCEVAFTNAGCDGYLCRRMRPLQGNGL